MNDAPLSAVAHAVREVCGHQCDDEAETVRVLAMKVKALDRAMRDELAECEHLRREVHRLRGDVHGARLEGEAAGRAHVKRLVAAMVEWGSEEDGVPEDGEIGEAFDAAQKWLRGEHTEGEASDVDAK